MLGTDKHTVSSERGDDATDNTSKVTPDHTTQLETTSRSDNDNSSKSLSKCRPDTSPDSDDVIPSEDSPTDAVPQDMSGKECVIEDGSNSRHEAADHSVMEGSRNSSNVVDDRDKSDTRFCLNEMQDGGAGVVSGEGEVAGAPVACLEGPASELCGPSEVAAGSEFVTGDGGDESDVSEDQFVSPVASEPDVTDSPVGAKYEGVEGGTGAWSSPVAPLLDTEPPAMESSDFAELSCEMGTRHEGEHALSVTDETTASGASAKPAKPV